MFILGAGSALPETILENSQLARGEYSAPCVTSPQGVNSRRTVLSLRYIGEEGNADPMSSEAVGPDSPTTLGARAVVDALGKARISTEQIGLFLGDSATPYQTTPSEAQRVAGQLGLKVNAYDLLAPGAAMALHFETVRSWKDDRTPDYVVSLSTNTPTRALDMRAGDERFLFGDGAGAVVMSTRHRGPLQCVASEFVSDVREISALDIPFAGHLKMNQSYPDRVVERIKSLFPRAVRAGDVDPARCKLIVSAAQNEPISEVVRDLKLSREQVWSAFSSTGDLLGATPYVVLAQHWEEIRAGDQLVVVLAGTGMAGGYVVMKGV